MTDAWVLETGSCDMGDHEIVAIFIGSEAAAEAYAKTQGGLGGLGEVYVTSVPVVEGWSPTVVIEDVHDDWIGLESRDQAEAEGF